MWVITGSRRDVLNTHQLKERKTRSCLFYFNFLKDMKIQTLMASSNDQCLYIRIYVVCCVVLLWDEQIWLWRPSCGSHVACRNINTTLASNVVGNPSWPLVAALKTTWLNAESRAFVMATTSTGFTWFLRQIPNLPFTQNELDIKHRSL